MGDPGVEFADEMGQLFAHRYGLAPIVGRLLGWLLVCEPQAQTPAELSEALGASRSSIGTAVAQLEQMAYVRRLRPAGERADRIRLAPDGGARDLDDPQQYLDQAALARRGLEMFADAPLSRRARLLELAAFADFLAVRTPQLAVEWRAHRDALRASGELPPTDD